MNTIVEIEAAIEKLPALEVEKLADWLGNLRLRRNSPAVVENWLGAARGAALPGVTTAKIMALTRSKE